MPDSFNTLENTKTAISNDMQNDVSYNKRQFWEYKRLYGGSSKTKKINKLSQNNNATQTRKVFHLVNNKVATDKDLVKRLLSREIQTRLGNLKGGAEDIKEQKWFSTIDFDAIIKRSVKAPWLPKITSAVDTSNFDPYEDENDANDNNFTDNSNWDKDF